MTDIKYLNTPNVCFSLTEQNDYREELFSQQRKERGFDSSELWSLRDTIGNFIIPRLKAFKEESSGYCPGCFELISEWQTILDKMIRAFELLVRDEGIFILNKEEDKEFNEGLDLFREWFVALWY